MCIQYHFKTVLFGFMVLLGMFDTETYQDTDNIGVILLFLLSTNPMKRQMKRPKKTRHCFVCSKDLNYISLTDKDI